MGVEQSANSRRNFIKTAATGLAAISVLPSHVVAGLGHRPPSSRLSIAAIGVGGVGFKNLNAMNEENIVALCDVDKSYGLKAFRRWPAAVRYVDFRKMLEAEKNIDAVLIAAPDHIHAHAASMAMKLGKHVFVQSPMGHSVQEIRRMAQLSKLYPIVSQVGNTIASSDISRRVAEIIWNGDLGEIREVDVWSSGPDWPQGYLPDTKKSNVPATLDWDLFLGPAEFIPYKDNYTPFGWRAFWAFGLGTLGSEAPQLLEPVFRALKLGVASAVDASSSFYDLLVAPVSEKIVFEFNRRDNLPKLSLPKVNVNWYDGGLMPNLPGNIPAELSLADFPSGIIFSGNEGLLFVNVFDEKLFIVKNGKIIESEADQTIFRIANSQHGHEADWLRACKEHESNRLVSSASFESQLALSETILVGNMALRLQSLKRKLYWDTLRSKFSNIGEDELVSISSPARFSIENAFPVYNKQTQQYNAAQLVEQWVNPTYREGWKLI